MRRKKLISTFAGAVWALVIAGLMWLARERWPQNTWFLFPILFTFLVFWLSTIENRLFGENDDGRTWLGAAPIMSAFWIWATWELIWWGVIALAIIPGAALFFLTPFFRTLFKGLLNEGGTRRNPSGISFRSKFILISTGLISAWLINQFMVLESQKEPFLEFAGPIWIVGLGMLAIVKTIEWIEDSEADFGGIITAVVLVSSITGTWVGGTVAFWSGLQLILAVLATGAIAMLLLQYVLIRKTSDKELETTTT